MSTETEDAHEDGGHHLPAVEDWPRGFGEASWWPFITAIGGAGIYVSIALWLLGSGENAVVGPTVGPFAFVAAVAVFLGGIYGWLYHAFVKHYWQRGINGKSKHTLRWGMLAFLGSEVATFGAGFAYYFFIRSAAAWPPEGSVLHHIELLNILVVANTALLVLSSVTIHFAHHSLREGNRSRFLRLWGITLLLGIVFLGGQALEYYEFIEQEGFTITSGLFGSAFFGLTGLHGLHVSMGVVMLGIVFVRSLKGQFSAERDVAVTTTSMYWHYVDAVWLFLVAVLYVGASI